MPNFFLSSAAGDDDPYVREFFADLQRRVSSLSSGIGAGPSFLGTVGNRDTELPPDMLLSLASCDVFIALTSPRYLLNATCGRQWQIFANRFPPGGRPAAMIAVAWAVDGEAAEFLGEVTVPRHDAAGRGLRQLARLRGLRQSYQDFVDELAQRVVAVGRSAPAPRAEPVTDFQAVPNAFAPSISDSKVHFIVAAATRDEMDKVRDNLAYYGPEAVDWAPYLPTVPGSLAARARLLAADQAMQAEVTALDDVLERIERARVANELVVVLVDWWITQLDEYQRILAEIDRRGLGGTAVLVPANASDAETMGNRDELRAGLRNTFRHAVAQPGTIMRTEIHTQDAFDSDLAGVIEEARNRLFRVGQAHLPNTDEPMTDRPILRGP